MPTHTTHDRPRTEKLLNHPEALEEIPAPRVSWYAPIKAGVEWLVALAMLVVVGPVILLSALLVRLTSPGPAFYTQTRLGRYGRAYPIYKLRSMRHDCEKASGACWSKMGDSRVTPFGRFLRRSHIDELPQLWNILCGHMSILGPRPERPEFIPELEQKVHLYRDRRLVRPGVTGLAQVQLPPDIDIDGVRRKLAYDLYYVRHCSLWLDLRVLLATALHILAVPYPTIRQLLFLPRCKTVERIYQEMIHAAKVVEPAIDLTGELTDPESPVADRVLSPEGFPS